MFKVRPSYLKAIISNPYNYFKSEKDISNLEAVKKGITREELSYKLYNQLVKGPVDYQQQLQGSAEVGDILLQGTADIVKSNCVIDIKNSVQEDNKLIEEYKIDELATTYCNACDAGDETNKNIYIAALILRFWYQINKMYLANPTLGYTREDFLDVVVDGIYKACEPRYRAWMDETRKVNAQQCINMCIQTKLRERYYFANLDKHRANQNTISFDTNTIFGFTGNVKST